MKRMRLAVVASGFAVGLAVVPLVTSGCRGENPAQMLETAKFEELQRNEEHARILYERIAAKFPNSEQAAVARARLAELDAAVD